MVIKNETKNIGSGFIQGSDGIDSDGLGQNGGTGLSSVCRFDYFGTFCIAYLRFPAILNVTTLFHLLVRPPQESLCQQGLRFVPHEAHKP
jgi:hypothetical protein